MNIAVLGAQWGDEGKGKVVDLLALRAADPLAHPVQQLRAACPEISEHDRDARGTRIEGSDDSPFEGGSRRRRRFV